MQVASVFEKAFGRMYGKPCWNVKPGYGSFLTFEFGKPHLEVHEPSAATQKTAGAVRARFARRSVVVHGDWHLWLYCCEWEVLSKGNRVGDSSTKISIRRGADFLDGQELTGFSISPRKIGCLFRFDLGATLRTRPYDRDSEQWRLFEPSHKVLTLRADGMFKHMRSDIPDELEKWIPIVPG
jgi:hypothetical protein